MSETFFLTDSERQFIDAFCHETATATAGSAVLWLSRHGIKFHEMIPLERARGRENPRYILETLDQEGTPVAAPWESADEFRSRADQAARSLGEGS